MPRPSRARRPRLTAAALIPPEAPLDEIRRIACGCEACDLFRFATQTVFGEGPQRARVMLVGEQPGHQEDMAGTPFVGPSGTLLTEALEEAQIGRGDVYITNVVKHFKWVRSPHGARRVHKKPTAGEIRACRPWLDAELDRVRPEIVICLGATAAQALLGKAFRVTEQRGVPLSGTGIAPLVIATVHPSSVLRAPDAASRARAAAAFKADLKEAGKRIRPATRNR